MARLKLSQLAEAFDHGRDCSCDLCVRAWAQLVDPIRPDEVAEIPAHLLEAVEGIWREEALLEDD